MKYYWISMNSEIHKPGDAEQWKMPGKEAAIAEAAAFGQMHDDGPSVETQHRKEYAEHQVARAKGAEYVFNTLREGGEVEDTLDAMVFAHEQGKLDLIADHLDAFEADIQKFKPVSKPEGVSWVRQNGSGRETHMSDSHANDLRKIIQEAKMMRNARNALGT
jgi:hypothetical protein